MISDSTSWILFNDYIFIYIYIYTSDINSIFNTLNINYHMYADDI